MGQVILKKLSNYEVAPKKEKRSKYGNPKTYKVFGKIYKLLESHQNYEEIGIASWYGKKFHGSYFRLILFFDIKSKILPSPHDVL